MPKMLEEKITAAEKKPAERSSMVEGIGMAKERTRTQRRARINIHYPFSKKGSADLGAVLFFSILQIPRRDPTSGWALRHIGLESCSLTRRTY